MVLGGCIVIIIGRPARSSDTRHAQPLEAAGDAAAPALLELPAPAPRDVVLLLPLRGAAGVSWLESRFSFPAPKILRFFLSRGTSLVHFTGSNDSLS